MMVRMMTPEVMPHPSALIMAVRAAKVNPHGLSDGVSSASCQRSVSRAILASRTGEHLGTDLARGADPGGHRGRRRHSAPG